MMDPEDRPQSTDDDAVDAGDGSRESGTDPGERNETDSEETEQTDTKETEQTDSEETGQTDSEETGQTDSEETEQTDPEESIETHTGEGADAPAESPNGEPRVAERTESEDRPDPSDERRGSIGETARRPNEDDWRSERGPFERFRHDREGPLMWIRELLASVAVVLLLGLLLFGLSGVWPPMVAVESGSMEPNMEIGDLVFVSEPGRFAPDAADNDIGVVTHETGQAVDYRTFGSYGSVVIYHPPGRTGSPIIHRAMFHVEEGENWYDRADDRFHGAENCEQLRNCPAPHDGYITLGDNNPRYDQASGLAEPVKAEWVTGVARLRIPYLGYIRLLATGQAEFGDLFVSLTMTDRDLEEGWVGSDGMTDSGTTVAAVDSDGDDGTAIGPPNGTHTGLDAATAVRL